MKIIYSIILKIVWLTGVMFWWILFPAGKFSAKMLELEADWDSYWEAVNEVWEISNR